MYICVYRRIYQIVVGVIGLPTCAREPLRTKAAAMSLAAATASRHRHQMSSSSLPLLSSQCRRPQKPYPFPQMLSLELAYLEQLADAEADVMCSVAEIQNLWLLSFFFLNKDHVVH